MQNEILETKTQNDNKKDNSKLIKLIIALVGFIALIAVIIFVTTTPIKVSFSAPGVTGFSMSPALVDKDGKIEVPNANSLKRSYYTFIGWYDNSDGKGEAIDIANTVFTESTTLYAIWEPTEYTITYDLDGGTLGDETNPETYTVIHEPTQKEKDLNDKEWHLSATELALKTGSNSITLKEPVKDDAVFAGWEITYTDKSGNTVTAGPTFLNTARIEPVGNLTIKALWN